jgi:hypothetical protein
MSLYVEVITNLKGIMSGDRISFVAALCNLYYIIILMLLYFYISHLSIEICLPLCIWPHVQLVYRWLSDNNALLLKNLTSSTVIISFRWKRSTVHRKSLLFFQQYSHKSTLYIWYPWCWIWYFMCSECKKGYGSCVLCKCN